MLGPDVEGNSDCEVMTIRCMCIILYIKINSYIYNQVLLKVPINFHGITIVGHWLRWIIRFGCYCKWQITWSSTQLQYCLIYPLLYIHVGAGVTPPNQTFLVRNLRYFNFLNRCWKSIFAPWETPIQYTPLPSAACPGLWTSS